MAGWLQDERGWLEGGGDEPDKRSRLQRGMKTIGLNEAGFKGANEAGLYETIRAGLNGAKEPGWHETNEGVGRGWLRRDQRDEPLKNKHRYAHMHVSTQDNHSMEVGWGKNEGRVR